VVPPGRGGEVDRLGVRVVSYGQSRKQRVIGKGRRERDVSKKGEGRRGKGGRQTSEESSSDPESTSARDGLGDSDLTVPSGTGSVRLPEDGLEARGRCKRKGKEGRSTHSSLVERLGVSSVRQLGSEFGEFSQSSDGYYREVATTEEERKAK
jgi:hypothetical protein